MNLHLQRVAHLTSCPYICFCWVLTSNAGNNIQPKRLKKKLYTCIGKAFPGSLRGWGWNPFFFFTCNVICTQGMIKLIISELAPPVLQEGEKCKRNEELQRHAKQRQQGDNECECCKTGLILIRTQPFPVQTCTRIRAAGATKRFLDFCPTYCFRPWLKDKSGKPL